MKQTVFYASLWMLIVFLSGTNNKLVAQSALDGRNVVTTAVPFLMITTDSRSGALGDAGVALPADANSIHWNPAKLAFVDQEVGLSLSYVPWLRALVPDINLSYLSGFKRIDDMSAFGASLRYFSLGDINFTDENGSSLGSHRPYELALDGAYSRKLSEKFSLGLSLRFIYSDLTSSIKLGNGIETKPGIAFAGDLAAFWKLDPIEVNGKRMDINFGINMSNVGSKITYTDETDRDFIPANLRLGSYFNYHIDEYNQIALTFDINKLLVPTPPEYDTGQLDNNGNFKIRSGKNPEVGVIQGLFQSFSDAPGGSKEEFREINPSVGIEYWYNKQFAGRAGYFYEHETKGNRKYFTLGIGLKYNILNIDVSYLIPTASKTANQTSPLENTLRFSLLFNFEANTESN
jgi:hypothetical protein